MTFIAAAIGATGLSAAAVGGIAAGVGAIGGAIISSKASKGAAATQAQSESDALAQNRDIFNQQVQLQEPWRQVGMAGLGRLNTLLGLTPGPSTPGLSFAPSRSVGPQITPGSTPLLTQGSDGVFAPSGGQAPGVESADAIRARLAPQFSREGPGGGMTMDENQNQVWHPGAPIVDEAALNAAVQAEVARQQAAQPQQAPQVQAPAVDASGQPIPPPPPPANDFTAPASLTTPFSAADFAADPAPKIDPFTPPNAIPTFDPATALQEDPGYQFRADQQQKALTAAAAAQGRFGSGSYLKDAMARSGDLASQEYGNVFNRFQVNRTNAVNDNKDAMGVYSLNRNNSLQDFSAANDRFQQSRLNVLNPLLAVSGFGQQAATTTGQAAQNFGNQAAAAITGAGNARAAGQVGSANAVNGAIGQGISMYQQNQLLSRFPVGGGSIYGGGVTPPNPYYGSTSYTGFDPSMGSAYSGF